MSAKPAEPRYTIYLGDRELATGDIQRMQYEAMVAVGSMLADDPDGVSMSAAQAHADFRRGVVAASVSQLGEWACPFWVHGNRATLRVTGVE